MSQISGSVKVAANKPIDTRFRKFASIEECLTEIESWCRYEGLEVNINGTKYWFRNGVNDNNLVPMPSGGGGSTSDDITNESVVTGATVTNALDTLNAIALDAMNDAENAGIAATAAISAANTANSNALNAQSSASSALTAANAAQTTADNAIPKSDLFSGDVTGTYDNVTVSKIHGTDVQAGTPSHGDFMIYEDGSNHKWQHRAAQIGDITGLQTALDGKQSSLGYTPENAANKSIDLTASDTKYPTVNAVNTGLATKQNSLGYTPLNRAGDTISGDVGNTSTGFFRVANGTTAQRPSTPLDGMIRYNTTTQRTEFYSNGVWRNHARLEGDTFTGAIAATNLSGTNTGDETTSTLLTKGVVIALDILSAAVATPNATTETTLYTYVIPASTLRARSKVILDFVISMVANANNKTTRVYLNGSQILNSGAGSTQQSLRSSLIFWYTGTQMRVPTSVASSGNVGGVGQGTSAFQDITPSLGNFTITITVQKSVGTDSCILEAADVSLRY